MTDPASGVRVFGVQFSVSLAVTFVDSLASVDSPEVACGHLPQAPERSGAHCLC